MAVYNDGTVTIRTDVDTKGIKTGVSNIKSQLNGLSGTVKKIGGLIAAAFAVKQVLAFSKACIDLGSDLAEVQNVVDVTFGNMSNEIDRFAKNAATQFGLSELSAKQYTSTIGAMLKSMGFVGPELVDMSEKMAGLAGDMASFYNLDTDEAFQKIRSGISGETEPLKQLGVNLSEANLEQFRLAQGMTTAYSKMNQQEKALLRYNYLLSVTSDAQGDFARTSGSWANQTRILSLQLQSIKADLGQGLINVLTPALKVINSMIIGLAKLASAFKAFTQLLTGTKGDTAPSSGKALAETADDYSSAADAAAEYADATDKSTKATKKAAKENDRYLSGLDHIQTYQSNKTADNTTPTPASTSGSVPAPVDFGSLAQGETVLDKVDQKLQKLVDNIKAAVKPTADALQNLWNNGLKKFGEFSWQALQDFYAHFLVPVGKWVLGEGIPRFVNALNDGLMKVNWAKINKALADLWDALAPFAINVGEGLLWLWEHVLVPLGTWTMNEVVPRFLKTIELAIKAVNAVVEALKPLWSWFWENVLKPVANWTGGAFLKIWDGINEALEVFGKWCKDHPQIVEAITVAVISFFAAWKIMSLVSQIGTFISTIGNMISVLGGLKGVIGIVTSGFNPWIAIIGAAITAGILLWKNWDTISAKAKEIWGAISGYLKTTIETIKKNFSDSIESIKGVFSKGWTAIKTTASNAWTGIKGLLSGAWNGIKSTASSIFGALGTTLSTAWSSMKTAASNAWSGISGTVGGFFRTLSQGAETMGSKISGAISGAFQKAAGVIKTPINGIIGLMNGLIGGLVAGINLAIGALNKIQVTVPRWVPVYGGKKFGFNLSTITAPRIPYLATGAVIPPNAPFAAVLGDQKQGTNIETPEKLMRQIFREEMQRSNSKYEFKAMLNRRVLFDEIITEGRMRQQMSASNPFELA